MSNRPGDAHSFFVSLLATLNTYVGCWLDEVSVSIESCALSSSRFCSLDVDPKTCDFRRQSYEVTCALIDAVNVNQKSGSEVEQPPTCVLVLRVPAIPSTMTPFRLTVH